MNVIQSPTDGGAGARWLRRVISVYRKLPISSRNRRRLNALLLGKFGFLSTYFVQGAKSRDHRLDDVVARLGVLYAGEIPDPAVFPEAHRPDVSVIIPVFNQVRYTALCLRSIVESTPRHSYEVLVVDDASTDDTPEVLRLYKNLHVMRNGSNLGFIRSCNIGAREARGRFLLFLNNDTWVLPGWLDELADTFAAFPQAGLVGSKLIYPNGLLQEAGAILWNDATGWNYGRLEDPSSPEFNYLRDVDYCSGASIMVPRDVFQSIGEFDERYAPAYFEDADLAFSVRRTGRRTLYQPLSRVVHFEGITSGRDLKRGVKSHQVTNRHKFLEKWRSELAHHAARGEHPHLEKDRGTPRRALIIDIRTPMPDKDAGSVTAFYYMRAFQDLGFKVTFIPAGNFAHIDRYTPPLQRLGIECLYAPHVSSVNRHLEMQGSNYDVVLLYRADNAAVHIDDVRRYCPNARVVFDTVDLHYLREQRQAKLEKSAAKEKMAARTKSEELGVMRKADATIVLSPMERALLLEEIPDLAVFTIPLLLEIPGRQAAFADRRGILFIGSYEHLPNVDAVLHFASNIWPLVRIHLTNACFYVIGSNPPPEVQALACEDIVVVGYVEDLSPYFEGCRVSVAPLRYGAGIKGKLGTSLSYGLPSVATSIAVEGMGLVHGENVLVADEPSAFAESVTRLHEDAEVWYRLSDAGLGFVDRNYSLAAGKQHIESMLDHVNAIPRGDKCAAVPRRPRPSSSDTFLASRFVHSGVEYREYREHMANEYARREAVESALIPDRQKFVVPGYCYVCGKRSDFLTDFRYAPPCSGSHPIPNWRERLVCRHCGLNNRVRASLHLFEQVVAPRLSDHIYVTEQLTPLFRWLKRHYPSVSGSEYLGESQLWGATSALGIRNESITRLTFPDSSIDHVLCFDVFEHVPDYTKAFVECLRCLKPGGTLLFTVPFRRDSDSHVIRAELQSNGQIKHLLPPEYHGDPVSSAGCLCYQYFGWTLLDELRDLGFDRAFACLYWSRDLGYLGGEQIAFIAKK